MILQNHAWVGKIHIKSKTDQQILLKPTSRSSLVGLQILVHYK